MAKIYGINGVISGRVNNVVYAMRNGVQVARKYNPIVMDPKSANQVAARAKMKLMTQLSAVFSNVIAIRPEGAKSSRNLFFKANYGLSSYNTSENKAEVDLTALTLTRGYLSLPSLQVARAAGSNTITVNIYPTQQKDIDRMVYIAFEHTGDNSLRFDGSIVVDTAGENNTFEGTLNSTGSSTRMIIYGYGIRDNNAKATVAFSSITFPSAQNVANLIVSRSLSADDITLTRTASAILAASANLPAPAILPAPANKKARTS